MAHYRPLTEIVEELKQSMGVGTLVEIVDPGEVAWCFGALYDVPELRTCLELILRHACPDPGPKLTWNGTELSMGALYRTFLEQLHDLRGHALSWLLTTGVIPFTFVSTAAGGQMMDRALDTEGEDDDEDEDDDGTRQAERDQEAKWAALERAAPLPKKRTWPLTVGGDPWDEATYAARSRRARNLREQRMSGLRPGSGRQEHPEDDLAEHGIEMDPRGRGVKMPNSVGRWNRRHGHEAEGQDGVGRAEVARQLKLHEGLGQFPRYSLLAPEQLRKVMNMRKPAILSHENGVLFTCYRFGEQCFLWANRSPDNDELYALDKNTYVFSEPQYAPSSRGVLRSLVWTLQQVISERRQLLRGQMTIFARAQKPLLVVTCPEEEKRDDGVSVAAAAMQSMPEQRAEEAAAGAGGLGGLGLTSEDWEAHNFYTRRHQAELRSKTLQNFSAASGIPIKDLGTAEGRDAFSRAGLGHDPAIESVVREGRPVPGDTGFRLLRLCPGEKVTPIPPPREPQGVDSLLSNLTSTIFSTMSIPESVVQNRAETQGSGRGNTAAMNRNFQQTVRWYQGFFSRIFTSLHEAVWGNYDRSIFIDARLKEKRERENAKRSLQAYDHAIRSGGGEISLEGWSNLERSGEIEDNIIDDPEVPLLGEDGGGEEEEEEEEEGRAAGRRLRGRKRPRPTGGGSDGASEEGDGAGGRARKRRRRGASPVREEDITLTEEEIETLRNENQLTVRYPTPPTGDLETIWYLYDECGVINWTELANMLRGLVNMEPVDGETLSQLPIAEHIHGMLRNQREFQEAVMQMNEAREAHARAMAAEAEAASAKAGGGGGEKEKKKSTNVTEGGSKSKSRKPPSSRSPEERREEAEDLGMSQQRGKAPRESARRQQKRRDSKESGQATV